MELEDALLERLLAVAPLAAIIGTRGAWFERPKVFPSMTLDNVFAGEVWTHDGPNGLVSGARVQIDFWALKVAQARDASVALCAEMARTDEVTAGGWRFLPPAMLNLKQRLTDTVDGKTTLFRILHDFTFDATPAA